MNIAIAATDTMAARTVFPIGKVLSARGHTVRYFVEGRADHEATVAGHVHATMVGNAVNPAETELQPPEFWDAELRQNFIKLLLVGTSNPIRCERALALAANRLGIPVAVYPDTWGAENRLGKDVKVDLWFAIDQRHANLIGSQAMVVGDPIYALVTAPVNEADRDRLRSYGDPEKMLLVVGQGFNYLADILVGACTLMKEPGWGGTLNGWRILPRLWHPKKTPPPELMDRFEEQLKRMGEQVVRFADEESALLSTDTLASLCGATISAFSTPLRIAAAHGNRAISVHTRNTRLGMQKSTGLDFYPPAEQEGPIYRWDVQDKDGVLRKEAEKPINEMPRGKYQPVPFDPAKAAGALLNLVV